MKQLKIWQLLLLLPLLALAACDSDDVVTPDPDPEPEVTDLMINEFMASNDSYDVDGTTNFPDWVELYNTTTEDINIGGWYMTDTIASDVAEWHQVTAGTDETIVPAGGFLVVYFDNYDDGPLYMQNKLGGSGESIGLADLSQTVMVAFDYEEQTTDMSMGHTPDGSGNRVFLVTPTPGAANSASAGNQPPAINDMGNIPLAPVPDEAVTVNAEVSDDNGLSSVSLFYTVNGGTDWTEVTMTVVAKVSDNYTAEIPGQADGTVVGYYVEAIDTDAETTLLPEGGADDPRTYEHAAQVEVTLVINEFMASNDHWDVDGSMEFPDWIEIYNTTAADINIGGWYMTDSPGDAIADWYQIPAGSDSTIVPAGGYLVLFADKASEYGILHMEFSLSGGGEAIALADGDETILASLTYGEQNTDATSGYVTGSDALEFLAVPTPGAANAAIMTEASPLFINEFMASNDTWDVDGAATFPDWIEIYNSSASDINIGGWYMTDGLDDALADWYMIPTGSDETIVPAGGFLVLFADKAEEVGVLHLSFSLGGSGETIGLANPDQDIKAYLVYGEQTTDISTGMTPDGSGNQEVLATPTPGTANSGIAGGF